MPDPHPPVVLIHGALCDSEIWSPQVNALEAAGYGALPAPLEGYFPAAFAPSQFSADRHVEQIIDLLGRLREPAHLVGHSRGGRLALAVAGSGRVELRSLALVEPGGVREPDFFPSTDPVPLEATLAEALRRLEEDGEQAAMEFYFEEGHGKGLWRRLPELVRVCAVRNAVTLHGMAADRSCPLSRSTARAVRCPVLLIEGAESPPIFRRIADVLAGELQQVSRAGLAHSDHFMPSTAVGAFNATLLNFIRSVDA